ncbi:type II secretion system F family protein [Porphyrobacter sp. LM 6]|uniref:type II secretion system F family protein n=1 Tax=Porphyrobacter sp. LM 6 TaxID=1896196 RepID=UPI0008473374|nr:type II secretion system F family protein [Porphyrobacter sp. LM 6]AOL93196.1 tight adherence protein C [Porphyrobacter sp. LM 6]
MIDLIASSIVIRSVVLFGLFAAIAFISFVGLNVTIRRRDERRALERLVVNRTDEGKTASLRTFGNESAWARIAQRLEEAGLSLADSKDDRLSAKLKEAGFNSPSAPRIFTLIRLALVFALPAAALTFLFLAGKRPEIFTIYLVGSALGIFGLFLPNLVVSAKADRRKQAIINGFPDCLDLMLVCIEAGLGIEAAMDRVGREVVDAHPQVSELLSAAGLQLRAGASRDEAFRALADTAGVEEIRSFTTLLIQSDKLGTSVGSTLRVYAEEMRERRRMRAEEKAHRLPVLISIPLVVFMLPVMIGVLMLPAAIRIVRDVAPLLAGG